MKITVTASRLDDLRRERDEYNAEAQKQQDIHDQQNDKYRFAEDYNEANIENAIRSQVPGLDGIDIRIDNYYGRNGIRVRFDAENVRDETKSLRWSWTVALDANGNITKESSSWSGVDVTTPEQVQDLQKTVNILSNLVSMDWEPILRAGIEGQPRYEDYISVREPKNRDSEFRSSMRQAFIDENIIGHNLWIKGDALSDGRWFRNSTIWYMIKSQTEKFYTVVTISDWTVSQYLRNAEKNATREGDNGEQIEVDWMNELQTQLSREADGYTERIKKAKLLPALSDPFEVMDMEGNIQTYDQNNLEPIDTEDTEAGTKISSDLVTM